MPFICQRSSLFNFSTYFNIFGQFNQSILPFHYSPIYISVRNHTRLFQNLVHLDEDLEGREKKLYSNKNTNSKVIFVCHSH